MSENRKLKLESASDTKRVDTNEPGLFLFFLLLIFMAAQYLRPYIYAAINFVLHYKLYFYSLGASFLLAVVYTIFDRTVLDYIDEKRTTKRLRETEFELGQDMNTGKPVFIRTDQRLTHMQIIGTTNAGKTSGVILPMCVHDIKKGNGLILVDGKSERDLLNQIYAYGTELGRKSDIQIFSLANPAISATYNPFLRGNAEQVTERFFSTLKLENQYYRDEQFRIFRTILSILKLRGEPPTPEVIREVIKNRDLLRAMAEGCSDKSLLSEVEIILKEKEETHQEKVSAVLSALSQFCSKNVSGLFNQAYSEIDLKQIYRSRGIVYFQLPTLMFPQLGPMVGRMMIAELKQILSEQQMASGENPVKILPLYLDDFNDYLDPSFESVLNKLRSAGLAVIFAHQSLSDLSKVSPEFREGVLTNTNIKFFMRGSHPETNEYAAKFIGTKTTEKTTSRASTERGIFFRNREVDTGERSVRDVEEYIVHPNEMKNSFGLWQGTLVVPERHGRYIYEKVEARPVPNLPALSLPLRELRTFSAESVLSKWQKPLKTLDGKESKSELPGNAQKMDTI